MCSRFLPCFCGSLEPRKGGKCLPSMQNPSFQPILLLLVKLQVAMSAWRLLPRNLEHVYILCVASHVYPRRPCVCNHMSQV